MEKSTESVHRIFVGFRCNNRCLFCAHGELSSESPEVDARLGERLAAIGPGARVAFVGGEPTLYAELQAWISEARRRGAREVAVQTNGRRLSEAGYARTLVASGASRFEVALQGSTAAMHDFHTGQAGSFRETGSGIRRARGEGAAVVVTTVVTRSNYRHLAEIVDVARSLGAERAGFRLAVTHGRAARGADPPVVPPLALVKPYLSRALARAKQHAFSCTLITPDAAEAEGSEWLGLGPVAVKLLRKKRAVDPMVVERFRREALVLGWLDHPHVVKVHDAGESVAGETSGPYAAVFGLRRAVAAGAEDRGDQLGDVEPGASHEIGAERRAHAEHAAEIGVEQ